MFLTLALATVVVFQQALTDSGDQAEVDAELAKLEKQDLASELNEASEARQVFLSSSMYLAIKAVELYRTGSQRKSLSASERDIRNFAIIVFPGPTSQWLSDGEKETHFEVLVTPRYLPGEKVVLDAPRKLGRGARYAVRRRDFRVTRSAF